jgi:hypothetical protein
LFGIVTTLCVINPLPWGGILPSHYVSAVIVFHQTVIVSDANVQKFLRNSLEHKLTGFIEQWKHFLTFCTIAGQIGYFLLSSSFTDCWSSRHKRGGLLSLIKYRKFLFGILSTIFVMLLFTIQKSLSWGGIPPALYVAAVNVFLQGSGHHCV